MDDRYYTRRVQLDTSKYATFIFLDTSACVSSYRSTDPTKWDPCSKQIFVFFFLLPLFSLFSSPLLPPSSLSLSLSLFFLSFLCFHKRHHVPDLLSVGRVGPVRGALPLPREHHGLRLQPAILLVPTTTGADTLHRLVPLLNPF